MAQWLPRPQLCSVCNELPAPFSCAAHVQSNTARHVAKHGNSGCGTSLTVQWHICPGSSTRLHAPCVQQSKPIASSINDYGHSRHLH